MRGFSWMMALSPYSVTLHTGYLRVVKLSLLSFVDKSVNYNVCVDVAVVSGYAIANPTYSAGERIGASPDGKWQEVKDSDGNRTGTRIDAGHPKTHDDPRAQGPHGHRDGVTNDDGTPWLPW